MCAFQAAACRPIIFVPISAGPPCYENVDMLRLGPESLVARPHSCHRALHIFAHSLTYGSCVGIIIGMEMGGQVVQSPS